jgi:hypothetical protein
MASVPVRSTPVFAATANATVPFAVPVDPDVIVMKAELLTAVHAHELPAVTATDPVPPSGGNVETLGAPTAGTGRRFEGSRIVLGARTREQWREQQC